MVIPLLIGLTLIGSAASQAIPTPFHTTLETTIDSGYRDNSTAAARVVFRHRVQPADTAWLQFHFSDRTHLPAGSSVRLTAADDDGTQRHDGRTLYEWNWWSASFNGGDVVIELVAGPNTRANRIVIDSLIRGLPIPPVSTERLCGPNDTRRASDDPRVGRLWVGCTGWLGGILHSRSDLMLSAGHCHRLFPNHPTILELNVPRSTSQGMFRRSAPDDQYPFRVLAHRSTGATGDWMVCSVGTNSNTGKTPTRANGGRFFTLGPTPTSTTNERVRITGYGLTDPPNSLSLSQKTNVGALVDATNHLLCYRADTMGGDSGSPVIHDATGHAIGIHAFGGCSPAGGFCNSGNSLQHPDIQAALAGRGRRTATFSKFDAGCAGTGAAPDICASLNGGGGTLTGLSRNNEYAFPVSFATTTEIAGFEVLSGSVGSSTTTVGTAIYADAGGEPAETPLATSSMNIEPGHAFYRTELRVTVPAGTYYVAVDHSAGTTLVPELVAGARSDVFWRRAGFGNTWALSTSVTTPAVRVLCPTAGLGDAAPSLNAATLPEIGTTYTLQLSRARPNSVASLFSGLSNRRWAGGDLPFSLSAFGAPGCDLLVAPQVGVGVTTDGVGSARIDIDIPDARALVGTVAFHQWFVFDPGANALGVAVSDGGETRIGG